MFDSENLEEFLDSNDDATNRNSEVGTIHVGLGIIFVALGVVVFRRLGRPAPGLLLGGILLILLGVPDNGVDQANPLNLLSGFLGAASPGGFGNAGATQDIARFAVLAVGTLLLAALLCCWDRKVRSGASSGEVEEFEDS